MFSTTNPNVLVDRDVNAHTSADKQPAKDVKSMEYHRQVLQNKLEEGQGKQLYISPSDNIMSPCTAKLSALRSKQVGKVKPKSLFAATSSRNLGAGSSNNGNMFGDSVSSVEKKNGQ